MKRIELLAPAKDLESGKAAIIYGADAVYIGAPKFGARVSAGNSIETIQNLIDYAHLYYAKVYVTLNTILHDNELDEVEEMIQELYQIGTDAIIIQDLGILELNLPPIQIFASTQTNNYAWQKVKFLEDAGIQRVILARELSLEQIQEIKSKTNVDLEFFVQGALCVSFSGQCFFSHAIGKGSANRGTCAQPCRSYYSLLDKNGKVLVKNKFLLSLKDLNLSGYIEEMIDAGISSFKIEGRLKDINYVKNNTAHLRKQIDEVIIKRTDLTRASSGYIEIDFVPDPEKTFNRGFTSYFLNGRNKDVASPNTQKSIGKMVGRVKSVASNYFVIDSETNLNNADGICFFDNNDDLQGTTVNRVENNKIFVDDTSLLTTGTIIYRNYDHNFNKQLNTSKTARKINARVLIRESERGIIVIAEDEDQNKIEFEEIIEKNRAINKEKAEITIKNQFAKSGDSVFKVTSVDLELNNPLFFPISVLNDLRRKTIQLLESERLCNYPRVKKEIEKTSHSYPDQFIDYKGNVLNSKAVSFYKRHGVKMIENAFEAQTDFADKEIMITKHCIKYQLGLCPKHDKSTNKIEEPLFLADNNRKYKLEFDCKQCAMKVIFLQ
ncbi:MAG: U32 family peptidase [Bacteroidales bacterium]|jgi:putative protease|nr:U32 family peptidase [Bacteroidales bacterium]